MGFFSAVSSALGSPLGSLGIGIGEKLYDNYASAEAATKGFDRQKWMAENAYQLKVKDLKAAGLNPMLAVMGPGAGFPGVGVARTDFGGASAGAAALEQSQNLEADTANKEAIRGQIDATISNIVAQTGKTVAETENVKAILRQINQQIEIGITQQAGMQIANKIAQLDWREKDALLQAAISLGNSKSYLAKYSLEEAKQMANFWSTGFGELMPFLKAVKGLIGR